KQPVCAGPLTADGGATRLDEVLAADPHITAIVVANVLTAAGALRRCAERGVSVPDDLSLVCIHDNQTARVAYPSLSAVSMPLGALGAHAMTLLFASESEADEQSVIVRQGIRFVPRESTAPPREAR